MLESGKCYGLKKKLRRVLGHWGDGQRVQAAVLNRVVRVGLIEKVTFEQRGKGISHMATCGRQRYAWRDRSISRRGIAGLKAYDAESQTAFQKGFFQFPSSWLDCSHFLFNFYKEILHLRSRRTLFYVLWYE